MKINAWIYFLMIIAGVITIILGPQIIRKEYALSIGFVLLMFGLYKISVSWKRDNSEDEDD